MKKLLISVILVLVACVLMGCLFPLAPIFVCVELVRRRSRPERVAYLAQFLKGVAVGIDILGGVLYAPLLNALFIKQGGYHFGKPGQTISYALARNQKINTLTDAGRALANLLNWLDRDHLNKALKQYGTANNLAYNEHPEVLPS